MSHLSTAAETTLRDASLPPGPKGHLLWGTVREFRRDILGTLKSWSETYGDAIRFRFFLHYHGYIFSHPDHNKRIFEENNRNYVKLPNPQNSLLVPLVGYGLLTNDGESWLRQRRLVQPAFHRRRIAEFSKLMTQATEQMMESWYVVAREGAAFEVNEEMVRLTLEIVGKSLFSVDLTREAETVGNAFTAVNRQFREFSSHPFGVWLMNATWLPRTRRFMSNVAVLDRVVNDIIDERRRLRRNGAGQTNDLLDLLMDARDEETGKGMDDRQLRDEVMTLMLAGHETTSNALTWTLYLLSEHPAVREELEQEVDRVLAGRTPTFADIPQLAHTTMVLEESMRLYPPAYAVARTAADEDVVGGYKVEKGAVITLSPYVTHRHPEFWEAPDRFDPQRFSAERKAQRPRYAYIPFGGGPRMCIGSNFAMTEATLILAMIVQRFRLDHVPEHPVELEPLITLRPRHGMVMRLRER